MDAARRSLFCLAGAAALFPRALRADSNTPKRLALFMRNASAEAALGEFRKRQSANLAALGWVEGRSLRLELHLVDDDDSRYAEAARKLVATRPDAIWTLTWFLAKALQSETTTIPIVAVIGDPVGAGLAKSIAEPGGNVTGISLGQDAAAAKQVELLRQLLPKLQVLYLFDGHKGLYQFDGDVHRGRIQHRTVSSFHELDSALTREKPQRGTAALVAPIWVGGAKSMTDGYRDLAQLAERHRVPSMGWNREFVEAGGLCCYSLEYRVEDRPRVAAVIDRMLRGGNPAKTPFELPTHALLGINRGTAARLGLELPAEWILAANHIVQ